MNEDSILELTYELQTNHCDLVTYIFVGCVVKNCLKTGQCGAIKKVASIIVL